MKTIIILTLSILLFSYPSARLNDTRPAKPFGRVVGQVPARAGTLNATENPPRTNLRSSYSDLSVSQVQSMPNISIREKNDWGFYGHSIINHSYGLKVINGDKVVIDHATGLMWHQSSSDEKMEWENAKKWVRELNSRGYSGYSDWRLPTVEFWGQRPHLYN